MTVPTSETPADFWHAKFQQATDASGTNAKDITGKAITQIVTANKQAEINLMAEELDIANNFNYIQLSVRGLRLWCSAKYVLALI
jgi:hypothetical protein